MNGAANGHLDEANFGDSGGFSVKSFDAFPKTKQSYLTSTRNGSSWTLLLGAICLYLTTSEVNRFLAGRTTHAFSVEQGISHDLQMNLDIIVAMRCEDLHINIQDAAGDRILAGDTLKKDPTLFHLYTGRKASGQRDQKTGKDKAAGQLPDWMVEQAVQYTKEQDVHDYLGAARGKKKFGKTPRLPRDAEANACRIYGNIEGNKVQGDFHITARGHGYQEMGMPHLDHSRFNFSHHVDELSFGPYFPSLENPLDMTSSSTSNNFFKFQYYLSIVPTIYTDSPKTLASLTTTSPPHSRTRNRRDHSDQAALLEAANKGHFRFNPLAFSPHTIFTNQYAVTEQNREVDHAAGGVPGIFFKYDIEPILLTVAEEWGGLLRMCVRCVNVIAGVLVAGGWIVSLLEWAADNWGRRMRRRASQGGGILSPMNEEKHKLSVD